MRCSTGSRMSSANDAGARLLLAAGAVVAARCGSGCGSRTIAFDEVVSGGPADGGISCDPDAGPPPRESPLDLVPYARLYASATQPNSGLPWPREAEDAIATVRDSDPASAWKAPVGKKSVVTVDLQPWLGRAPALSALSASFTGARPEKVSVDLHAGGCGGAPSETLPWPDLAAPLDIGGARAGCVEISFLTRDAMALSALSLTTRDGWIPDPANLAGVAVAGGAAGGALRHPTSGVIEGFYGMPWSWRERAHMVKTMGALGLGAYVYGPKLDPKHRAKWREAYTLDEMNAFARLNTAARREGVTFLFGLSPFIDYDHASDADYEALKGKLGRAIDAGITGFVVMADDIEFETSVEVGATLAAIHVDVVNRLHADLLAREPRLEMWFVGTVYSDERAAAWAGGRAYLEGLAALDPAIGVMWTGRATSSATMTGAEMAAVTAATGHKPLVWDNYWANDGGDGFTGKILLGPFLGRGPDLPPAVDGIAQNPMIQGSLARLVLGTFGDWLDTPSLADEDAMRAYAAQLERLHLLPSGTPGITAHCGLPGDGSGPGALPRAASAPDGIDLLPTVMKVFRGGAMGDSAYREMEDAMDALVAAAQAGAGIPAGEAATALRVFARMATLRSEIRHTLLDPDLVDELEFPLGKVKDDGEAGLWTLMILGEKLAGRDGSAWSSEYQRAFLRSGESRFIYSAGKLDAFHDKIGALAPRTLGFAAPAIAPPGSCATGAAMAWKVAEGAAVEAFGLPGATIDGGTITWTPPHSGVWDAAVVATTDAGWSFALYALACVR